MANYSVNANIPVTVQVSSYEIVEILKREKAHIFGSSDNYLFLGNIYKKDEQGESVLVKELTYEEWELANSVDRMIAYFYSLGNTPR